MDDMISYDFTLDNILSVKAPKGTDPDTLHEAVRDKLITLIQGKHECFMFEGTFEEDSNTGGYTYKEENCECGLTEDGVWSEEVFDRFGCTCDEEDSNV